MSHTTFTRAEILERLRGTVSRRRPILCATAGNGLIARSLEAASVDLLLTSVTGLARQRGLPSVGWRITENNQAVREIIDEIAEMVHDTPIIASIGAGEAPIDADLGELVDEFAALGYSGLLNYPTMGSLDGRDDWQLDEFEARGKSADATDFDRRMAEAARVLRRDSEEKIRAGRGYPRELELVSAAHARDIFTMGYAWTRDQAIAMVGAGADVIVGHCGGTAGGAAGRPMVSHEEAAAMLRVIFDAARETRDDVLLMGHGGPFAAPADTARMYELTDAVGFLSGSAVERIPVERAVMDAVTAFKSVPIDPKGT